VGVLKNLKISDDVLEKITKRHNVNILEVEQAFSNRYAGLLEDKRFQHKTNPPTLWFLAPTNAGRRLKIVYMQIGLEIHVKSAFEPNTEEERIYMKFA
jgi:uncharacterized DUF497 family protein